MARQHDEDEFRIYWRDKTLADIEAWEIKNGPLAGKIVNTWQWIIVQEIKKEREAARRKTFRGWYEDHRDQLILVVIFGTVVAVVGGLIVAWITLPWKP